LYEHDIGDPKSCHISREGFNWVLKGEGLGDTQSVRRLHCCHSAVP